MKLTQKIAAAIVSDIREKELVPGDSLAPESEMCERFEVSRTVVREALTSLSAAGVIETGNGRKPRVAAFDPEVFADLFSHGLYTRDINTAQIMEARRGVEMETVRIAALRRTDEDLAKLDKLVEEMAASTENHEKFGILDFQFHLDLAAATQNRVFVYMITALRKPIQNTILTSFTRSSASNHWLEKITADHLLIARLVREQKVEAAVMAMTNHLDQSLSAQNFWVVN